MCGHSSSRPVAICRASLTRRLTTEKLRNVLHLYVASGNVNIGTRLYVDACYDSVYMFRYVITNAEHGDVLVLPDDGKSNEWFIAMRSHESLRFVSRSRTRDLNTNESLGESPNIHLIQYVLGMAKNFKDFANQMDVESFLA